MVLVWKLWGHFLEVWNKTKRYLHTIQRYPKSTEDVACLNLPMPGIGLDLFVIQRCSTSLILTPHQFCIWMSFSTGPLEYLLSTWPDNLSFRKYWNLKYMMFTFLSWPDHFKSASWKADTTEVLHDLSHPEDLIEEVREVSCRSLNGLEVVLMAR